jgi:3-oxoacyl-[acyl-carrier protein] reductase
MERKVFLVTGTSRGIGRELCEYYLGLGHSVTGCSRSSSDLVHPAYTHFAFDVSDEKAVKGMVRETIKKHGRIDVLLNNAGIASMNPIVLTPYKTAVNIFNTNFFGTFLFIREVGKAMIRQKKGRIVNFSTVATPLRLEGEAIYAASKASVVSLTEIAARELAPHFITVNAVGPTPTPTDLIRSVPKDKMDALVNLQAIKRLGTIQDITNVTDFFIDDKSDFVTGQTIYLGGVNH